MTLSAHNQDAETMGAAAEVLEPCQREASQLVHRVQVVVQVLRQLVAEARRKALQPLDAWR